MWFVSFWDEENILKLGCGDVTQLCKYTKNHYIVKKLVEYDLVIVKYDLTTKRAETRLRLKL